MGDFEEYLRQGEPDKAEKARVWKTAIGLQQVDGLTPSEYLIETARKNSADSLKATLEFDFEQEKKFSYKGLSQQEIIEHIVRFISYLWQIHIFGEGNTRTTAIFLIKYLRTFGFNVDNDLFAAHSWYFRNALVRANYNDYTKNIHATNEFLLLFFGNLLLGENHSLKNREMHVLYVKPVTEESEKKEKSSEKSSEKKEKSSEKIMRLIKADAKITIKELAEQLNVSTRTVEKNIAKLKSENRIKRIGGDKGGQWKIIE